MRSWAGFVMLLSAGVVSAQETREPAPAAPALDEISGDEYAVVAAILLVKNASAARIDDLIGAKVGRSFRPSGPPVVSERTALVPLSHGNCDPEVASSALFAALVRLPAARLFRPPAIPLSVVFAPGGEVTADGGGVTWFSRVAFDSTRTHALVRVEKRCGKRVGCGGFEFLLLERDGKQWKVLKEYCALDV